jgi:menaquinone-dependent protoporphyrinogen IX oxidase
MVHVRGLRPPGGVWHMRVGLAYYSRKGTTDGLAGMIAGELRGQGHEVDVVRIEHVKRPGFFKAARMSVKEMDDAELANGEEDLDMSDADMVIVGGPVFAGNINPFTRTYLARAKGLEGKPAGVFICCASRPDDAGEYIDMLTRLATERGLEVRGSLTGSNKVRDQYPRLAKAFVDDLLASTP